MDLRFVARHSKLFTLLSLFIAVVVCGTLGFMVIEGLSFDKAFHLTIATVTTVGYGDVAPASTAGRFFSDFMMLFGIGVVFYSLTQLMETVISGRLRELLKMVDYAPIIEKMTDHTVVCGYGRVGKAAVKSLCSEMVDVVVVDKDEAAFADLPKAIVRIVGDCTHDEVLSQAGIQRAKVVLVTFGNDADSILTVVSLKYLKPGINTIVRVAQHQNIDKMYKVGADTVVSPELEGGKSMSSIACVSYGKGPRMECAPPTTPSAAKGK
jgi:voltage-gated potassium channel